MLEFLRITNLALIDDLELEFAPGLNALTGETGAGKSFIMRAVTFLTGEKLPADFVRPGREKARVEAVFVDREGTETIIRRELSGETGRSRLFVNDRLSSIETVAAMRDALFLHTSQHAQQKLLSVAHQCALIDRFAPDQTPFAERDAALARLKKIAAERETLAARYDELAARRDFLEYQLAEIKKVDPKPGEEQELTARKAALGRSRETAQSVDDALGLLAGSEAGLVDRVAELAARLTTLAEVFKDYAEDAETLTELRYRLEDLEGRLRRQKPPAEDDDPEAVEARLFELSQLRRKLSRELEEIVDLGRELEESLSFLDSCALDLARLDKAAAKAEGELRAALKRVAAQRESAAAELTGRLEKELAALGFSERVQVRADFTPTEIFPGILEERARLLFVPNPGQPPQPLERIASGGELSRFLLALTGLIAEEKLPTLIFDEVDSGVGGLTLTRVADKLAGLAGNQQVILITHWPQLAARAQRHFLVEKEVEGGETFTRCLPLDKAGVGMELSRMAGGGEQGKALAAELQRAT